MLNILTVLHEESSVGKMISILRENDLCYFELVRVHLLWQSHLDSSKLREISTGSSQTFQILDKY